MANVGDKQEMVLERLRSTFASGKTKKLEYRKEQLKNLLKMYQEGEQELIEALKQDLGKPTCEAINLEIDFNKNVVKGTLQALDRWTSDEYVEKNLVTLLDTTYIHREPVGVCLVMGAWNYPVQLTLQPVSGAIAAGNCVVIKPSELAPATSKVIEKLIPKYMDQTSVAVVTGGIPETTELLKKKFDYIFFTGGTNVGKIVAQAAAKHLTPCTLELGGKCPIFVDETVDMTLAAKRLVWGKAINLGQTCVAPDYVLCNAKVQERLIPAIKAATEEFFGTNPKESSDLCRIVSDRHFQRLKTMLDQTKGTIVQGGQTDEKQRYMDLTVVTEVGSEDALMQEEIFGPILPIMRVESVNEAMSVIQSKDKPLSLYIFSEDKAKVKKIIQETSSGSVCVNDVIVQLSVETLPFGGVGSSGYGAYHGKYTYDTFSHRKSILVRDFGIIGENLGKFRYPPYTNRNVKAARLLLEPREFPQIPNCIKYLTLVGLGVALVVATKAVAKAYNQELPDWI